MFCRFCGAENDEGNVFCKKCGKMIADDSVSKLELTTESALKSNEPSLPKQQTVDVEIGGGVSYSAVKCPNCGNENCQPISKADVHASGGGYNFWNGCCGRILLGPVGYLCGACGSRSKVRVRNETWFVCNQCGTEFMSKQSAIENAVIAMRSSVLYTAFLTIGFMLYRNDPEAYALSAVCIAIIAAIWASIPFSISRSTGRKINELLTSEEKTSFWLRFAGYLMLGLMIGWFLGK